MIPPLRTAVFIISIHGMGQSRMSQHWGQGVLAGLPAYQGLAVLVLRLKRWTPGCFIQCPLSRCFSTRGHVLKCHIFVLLVAASILGSDCSIFAVFFYLAGVHRNQEGIHSE